MKRTNKQLGMDAVITRRDFLNGASVAVGSTLLPAGAFADVAAQDEAGYYPPGLDGMRGSHPGSFEVAHALRDGSSWEAEPADEEYDLVVVGGGISGLSAAWFFRQAHGKDARVLILDNHDDFGGHAKRNEFEIDGRRMIGFGGTMSIESPGGYPANAKRLLNDLGIDTQRFYTAFDQKLYAGLERGVFLREEGFGRDHLAVGDLSDPKTLDALPLTDAGRADLKRLLDNQHNYLDDLSPEAQLEYLNETSYETFLRERAKVGDEAVRFMRALPRGVWAIDIDAFPARAAWSSGYPGFGGLELDAYSYAEESSEPFIFHFPDGNASIARMLVRAMIPGSAPGNTMEDIVSARFDYSRLDEPESAVRIRLNSTVVRAQHVNGQLNAPVDVTYVRDRAARTVRARRVVMACYHAIVPRLCPELPTAQQAALSTSLRAPLVYTNVLIRNWTSFAKLGIHRVRCPDSFFHNVMLDFPVSLGDYRFARSPDEPVIVHMNHVPGERGLSAREQFRAGKRKLLGTSFATFEREVREQLGRMLGKGGFDPARDIAAITVNRWPHGYAYGYDPATDRVAFEPSNWSEGKRHWKTASRRFGNIAFASTDAASNAMSEAAIEEAYRAVEELR
ncbi:MAG: FAD-dependent oxidoreductase [Pseudomonadota bacterium]